MNVRGTVPPDARLLSGSGGVPSASDVAGASVVTGASDVAGASVVGSVPSPPGVAGVAGVPGVTGGVPTVLGHGADLMLGAAASRPAADQSWGRWRRGDPRLSLRHGCAGWIRGGYRAAVVVSAVGAAGVVVAGGAARGPAPTVEQLATFTTFVVLAAAALFTNVPVAYAPGGGGAVRPPEHPYRDALSPWTLPVALLLPPTYSAVMHLPLVVAGWFRLRPRSHVFFDGSTLTLAGLGSAYVHRALVPNPAAHQIDSLVGSAGRVAALFGAVAVFAATVRLLRAGLALTPGYRPEHRRLLGNREAVVVDSTETCSAIVVAVLWTAHPLLLFATTPPALLLQRNLRHAELLHASRTDTKTGLANPAYWREVAEVELLRAQRAGRPTSVLLVDVDHFKLVNDTYGHLVGDAVLSCVADTLRAATRPRELVGRFGGEEFVVLLAGVGVEAAVETAERIRRQVAAARCRSDGRPPIAVTVSVGVASGRCGESVDALLEHADLALYEAKSAGRDRVRAAPR